MENGQCTRVPANAELTLLTLGRSSLVYLPTSGETVEVLGAGKALALVVYLARSPNRTATREHLASMFWAETDPHRVKAALRQMVWYIRQRLGDDAITTNNGTVTLRITIDADVDLFQASIDDGSLERAVELYTGPFLQELAVPGGAEFERWAELERSRLESSFLQAAELTVHSLLSLGRTPEAVALAKRVRDARPYRQTGWRLLLETLLSNGEAVQATTEADELERIMAEEGIAIELATADSIRLARSAPARSLETTTGLTLVAELVGREREFSTIINAWEGAKAGRGRHITIAAAAGLGKTRLLNDVHARLHASGAQVVHLRANVGERRIDYALASHLAAAMARLPGAVAIAPVCADTLVALNPSLSSILRTQTESASGNELLRRRSIALGELLSAIAAEQPIALLIDDLHWMDDASRMVLGGLAGSVPDLQVMMLTATRPNQISEMQDLQTQELTLAPLSEEHVMALMSSLGQLPNEAWVSKVCKSIHSTTGGSPLLLLETLQLARDRGSIELTNGVWLCVNERALIKDLETESALQQRIAAMQRDERWVLLLLSVAGTPLAVEQLRKIAGGGNEALDRDLTSLEHRGFLARCENEFEPAHDELGYVTIQSATPEALSAAHTAVADVIVEDAEDDCRTLTRACTHLALSGDRERMKDVFKRLVRCVRSRGDGRPAMAIARDVLGETANAGEFKNLVDSLPLHFRLGLTSSKRTIAAAAVALIVSLAVAIILILPESPHPDVILVAFSETGTPYEAAVRANSWAEIPTIELSRGRHAPIIDSALPLVASPDGRRWAFTRLTGDSGEFDVYVTDEENTPRRLTSTPNDDIVFSWSPDGTRLAIGTSRWDAEENYDGAIIDVETLQISRLTDTPLHESDFIWSPDGTRIGFLRRHLPQPWFEVCWTTTNGYAGECSTNPDFNITKLLAWHSQTSVLIGADSGGLRWLARFDFDTHRLDLIKQMDGCDIASTSRDGRWVAARCFDEVDHLNRWVVFHADAPDQERPLSLIEDASEPRHVAWVASAPDSGYLNEISIDQPEFNLSIGVPHRLFVRGTDLSGQPMSIPRVQWRLSDTSIASVDSSGFIVPSRSGQVLVHASAGGWRRDSALLIVDPPQWEQLAVEGWAAGWDTAWKPYGDPRPKVTLGPDTVPSLWINGDRDFISGAYNVAEWDIGRGLGVEASVSTLINSPDVQDLFFGLVGWLDGGRLSAWDHTHGWMPGRSDPGFRYRCALVLTPTDKAMRGSVRFFGPDGYEDVQTGRSLHTGEWHRLRIQIFTDGTCGAAVDGIPLARTTVRLPFELTYQLLTEGKSIDTRILLGPLDIWRGVKDDVDWRELLSN